MSYVSRSTLERSVARLRGTAGHFLKIWLVLKHMGLEVGQPPVQLDTANSTPSLIRLFDMGDPDKRFFVPFAHSKRYAVMKGDASRSIVQTTVQRWASSGSVVTCDPTGFLDISSEDDGSVLVTPGRSYPLGLGHGESGFALEDGQRCVVPATSLAVWYGRRTDIPDGEDAATFLMAQLVNDLHLSITERELVLASDDLVVETVSDQISKSELYAICQPYFEGNPQPITEVPSEAYGDYVRRVKSMSSQLDRPQWLRSEPHTEMRRLLAEGAPAILLYGPPRTGKTRFIDSLIGRADTSRATIQIHDGWTYDHLVEGLVPDAAGVWDYRDGALKRAITDGKRFIVLEEVNRTDLTQALGEVFSLIEASYRGEENAIVLRSGDKFSIPSDVTLILTMNTVDKSTEEIDDALLGRVASVEFPPSIESLVQMLESNGVPPEQIAKLAQVHAAILEVYPLGHGYFAGLSGELDHRRVLLEYKARIRPVIRNFLGELREDELGPIDNTISELFDRP